MLLNKILSVAEPKLVKLQRDRIVMNKRFLLDLTCIFWLCNTPIRMAVTKILLYVNGRALAEPLTIAVIFLPLILYILTTGKIPWKRFHWMLLACCLFFGVTYLIHPEYKHWYTRDAFGVVDAVLRPDKGAIWAFLMVEISRNAKELWKNFQLSAVGIFLYNLYLWVGAKRIGYWSFVDAKGLETERSYSLDFGYSMVFVLLVLLFTYISTRKKWLLLSCALILLLILDSGSRGSFLCVFMCAVLLFLNGKWSGRQKFRNLLLITAAGCMVMFLWNWFLSILIVAMKRFNISSRTLEMLVNDEAMDDSGRDIIYSIIKQKIAEKPILGYGAFGDRQFIGPRFNWGYSHSIVYEMWADFGVIFGTLFLGLLLFCVFRMIWTSKDQSWIAVGITVFSIGSRLAVSNTFWGDPYFWMMCALLFQWIFDIKRDNRIFRLKY